MTRLMPDMNYDECRLFCTPPPEDVQTRLNSGSEKGSSTTAFAEEQDLQVESPGAQRTEILVE